MFGRRNPLGDLEVKGMRAEVKSALPAFDSLTVGLLANMSIVAFDRSTASAPMAGVLQTDILKDFNDGIGDIAVVILTAHVTTFTGQVIAIADFCFFSPAMIFFEGVR